MLAELRSLLTEPGDTAKLAELDQRDADLARRESGENGHPGDDEDANSARKKFMRNQHYLPAD